MQETAVFNAAHLCLISGCIRSAGLLLLLLDTNTRALRLLYKRHAARWPSATYQSESLYTIVLLAGDSDTYSAARGISNMLPRMALRCVAVAPLNGRPGHFVA